MMAQEKHTLTRSDNSYDIRVVSYEQLSEYTESMFDALATLVDPGAGEAILDCGAGYGAVTQSLIRRRPQVAASYTLLELSTTQIGRARDGVSALVAELDAAAAVRYVQRDVLETGFPEASFDTVIAKMVLHELPADQQRLMIRELYRILKPGGRLFVWQTILTRETVGFYNNLMRMKDLLAGYTSLVRNRHFITEEALFGLLADTGFRAGRLESRFAFKFSSLRRLRSEMHNDPRNLARLNQYILTMVQEQGDGFAGTIQLQVLDNDVQLTLPQGIYSARR